MHQMEWLSLRLCRLTNCICISFFFFNCFAFRSNVKAFILIIVWGRCEDVKVALIVCPQFRVLDHLEEGGGQKPKTRSSLLLQIFLFAVPPGNSERIAGDGVRRSHAGKSKAKNDLSCQRGIWWLPEAQRWEPRRRACMRAECRCADNRRRCAQPKRTFLGQWFFSTSTGFVFFCHHLLGCNSSMHRDRRRKIGNRRVSNTEIHLIPKIVSSD